MIGFVASLHTDQLITIIQANSNFTVGANIMEIRQIIAANIALGGREENMHRIPQRFIFRQRHERRNFFIRRQWENIHKCFTTRIRRTDRQAIHFQLIDLAFIREEQYRRMRIHHQQFAGNIFIAHIHARFTFATAALCAVSRKRSAFDIAVSGDRHHHVFFLDQIFDIGLKFRHFYHRAAWCRKLFFRRKKFRTQNAVEFFAIAENRKIFGNFRR